MFKIIITVSVTLNFILFIAGAFIVFERGPANSSKLSVISYCILLAMVGSLAGLITSGTLTNATSILALSCTLLSLILFIQCFKITRLKTKLTPIFSSDIPSAILQRGPYKYIRHPFYTSYMLTFFGSAVASSLWWCYAIALFSFILYNHASQFEEAKFEKSELASQYKNYRTSAGRFIPRLKTLFR